MSPHRIADAARISPYPSTIRAQEPERPDGTLANSTSGSGSGTTSTKARLIAPAVNNSSRSTRNVERSSASNGRQAQEEEVRFNIGPRNIRNLMSRRHGRGGRSGRAALEGIEEGVPDYPPPSFQEAVGTPAAPSNVAGPSSERTTLQIPAPGSTEGQHDMSSSDLSSGRGSPSETHSASESEDSLEIIETVHPPGLPRGVQDHRGTGRQGIEFPSPGPSLGSPTCVNASVSPSSESVLSRGRAKTKLKSVLDLTEDVSEPEPDCNTPRSAKKRFLSLSPLRTLFPPKHQALEVRALSAHPTPGTSPYTAPHAAHFFRSTTSLATSSVLRLPFASSTLTLTANKPESVKSRRFFHGKEKEKEKEGQQNDCPPESLDSWELLETEDNANTRKIEYEPRSLMATIAAVSELPNPPMIASELSPTRSLSFTYGAPPTPTALSPVSSQPIVAPAQTQPTTVRSWNEPHPLSLRDKKVAEAIEPFLRRRPRKDGTHHRSRTTPNPIVAVTPPVSPGAGPPVTTVRTRMSPTKNHPNNQSISMVDANVSISRGLDVVSATGGHKAITTSERGDSSTKIDEHTHNFQQALETPLPSSPLQTSFLTSPLPPASVKNASPASLSSSPSSVTISVSSSPTTPVPARSGLVFEDGGDINSVQPPPVPTPKMSEMLDTPLQRPTTIECACKQHSPTAPKPKAAFMSSHNLIPQSIDPTPPPARQYRRQVEPVMPSSSSQVGQRRHYHGRPLPRPPQPPRNIVVDSIYAGHEAYPAQTSGSPNTSCPEGLLIDLENDVGADVSGSWTPPLDEHSHQQLYPPSAPMTPNRTSPINSSTPTPDPSIRSLPLSFSSANVSSISGLSEMTDLDLLATALSEGENGADYETLLLISDFLESADEARARTGSSSDYDNIDVNMGANSTVDESDVLYTGRVEVQRRRVTSDGRVKLKMSVLGVSVNRCGICISQFRDEQHASLSPLCRHVFHENCLRQWLARSRTCPLCRISLDSGNH